MDMYSILNDYTEVKECTYKGEHYSVRDNGAIYRCSRPEGRKRKYDNEWIFGTKNPDKGGYMFLGSTIRVHQVVATAFHGTPQQSDMVVDHIDTNRCNNRPENLRWVTRLENALNNPITLERIIFYCGSIEAFLSNPSILKDKVIEPNLSWMRTVTKEEAAACKKNLDRRTARGNKNKYCESGGSMHHLDESIFRNDEIDLKQMEMSLPPQNVVLDSDLSFSYRQIPKRAIIEEIAQSVLPTEPCYTESLTPSALQMYWKTPTEFPLCPKDVTNLGNYYNNLKVDEIFCTNPLWQSLVVDFGISPNDSKLYVATHNPDGIKKYALTCIFIDKEHYIHQTDRTCFDERTMKRELALFLGREWYDDEPTFDDGVE